MTAGLFCFQMTTASGPVVLQLLGRWNNSQIDFPLPNRHDFYASGGRASSNHRPYIVINQLLLCHKHSSKIHFPQAPSSLYPGALDLEEQPPVSHEDWVPTLRTGDLLNWNLEEETAPLVSDDEKARVRRQTGPGNRSQKLRDIKAGLGSNDSYINAYFYNTKIVKSFVNAHAKLTKNLLNEITRNFVTQVAAHFSHVWPANANFNVVAIPVSASHAEGDFVISIVLPPYCTLAFSDCSVMQALGFDVVNQPAEEGSILKRTDQSELPWFLANPTGARKVFKAKRAIQDIKLSGLRIKARQVRNQMSPAVKASTPEIVKDLLPGSSDTLTMSVEYTGNDKTPPTLTTEWAQNLDALMTTGATAEKIGAAKNFYKSLLDHLCSFYGFHREFYSLISEPEEKRLVLTHGTLHPHSTRDQLSVEFVLGEKAFNYFLAASQLDNPLVWNVGVQSPLPITIEAEQSLAAATPVEEEEEEERGWWWWRRILFSPNWSQRAREKKEGRHCHSPGIGGGNPGCPVGIDRAQEKKCPAGGTTAERASSKAD